MRLCKFRGWSELLEWVRKHFLEGVGHDLGVKGAEKKRVLGKGSKRHGMLSPDLLGIGFSHWSPRLNSSVSSSVEVFHDLTPDWPITAGACSPHLVIL